MIELKINFKFFKLEMLIGGKVKPWFKSEITEEGETPKNTNQENNSFDENIGEKTPVTHISELAQQYQKELNTNQAFPPETSTPPSSVSETYINRSDVSSFTSEPIFLPKTEGIYDIGGKDSDPIGAEYEDYPDVEIISDDYEVRLEKATKLANQRYATYKETHDIN